MTARSRAAPAGCARSPSPGVGTAGATPGARDLGGRRRLEEELADTREMFELGFNASLVGNALVAADGRWLKVNPALARIVDRSEAELLAGSFQDITHPEDLPATLRLVQDVIAGRRTGYELEKRYVRPDGTHVWVLLNVAAVRRSDGAFRFFIAQMLDISRRKADEEVLQYRADHDPLTGLWNRRRFAAELAACWGAARRAGDRPVLLILDLDGFKAINDEHGHAAGDAHLCDVAEALRACTRSGDACARLGGDEFAVLLPDADVRTASATAARLAARITGLGRGAVSIGVAPWSPEDDVDAWLNRADQQMYEHKSRHRRSAVAGAGAGGRR